MSYNLLLPVLIVQAGDMSLPITSDTVEIKNQDNMGVQLHWTGSPVGHFTVQISSNHKEDQEGNVQVPGNWVSLTLSPDITVTGTPDDAYIDLNQLPGIYLRLLYTPTSGTGVLTAYASGKGV